MNDKERWLDIKGYEGEYQISSFGRVRSLKSGKFKILKPKFNGNYNQINLCKNGVCKKHFIHRLVAEHFVDNPENKPQVNHKDGNKTNNHYLNLEWVTPSENEKHAYDIGVKKSLKGTEHGRNKLSETDVLAIYYLSLSGRFTNYQIAELFNISYQLVSDIKHKKRWKHLFEQAEKVELLNAEKDLLQAKWEAQGLMIQKLHNQAEKVERYEKSIKECIERMNEGGPGTRSFVYEKLTGVMEGTGCLNSEM